MRENPCGWALDPVFPTRPGVGVTAKPFTALARWWERRFEWRRRLQAGGRNEKETRFGRLAPGPRRRLSGRWTSPGGGGWGEHRDRGARSQGAGRQVPTWAKCRLSKGRAPGSRSAGAASPPRRPRGSWALPRRRQPRGSRPCLAPARGSRPPADLPSRRPPRRGPTSQTAGPGAPWAEPIPGSPPTASQSWVGKGILARRRLRAGRQVSAATGRDTGRDPCPVPTPSRGARGRTSALDPAGGAGPRESCSPAPLPGPCRGSRLRQPTASL